MGKFVILGYLSRQKVRLRVFLNRWPEWTPERAALFKQETYRHPATFQSLLLVTHTPQITHHTLGNMGKCKEQRKPQRLTAFFSLEKREGKQYGTGSPSTLAHRVPPRTLQQDSKASASKSPRSSNSYSSTPLSGSPEKSRFKMDTQNRQQEASYNSIEEFQTTNQPVLDTVMNDMLMSLRSLLQADMASCMHKFHKELGEMEARVDHVKHKMGGIRIHH